MTLIFQMPKGFEMSPDMEVGGQFEAVGTFQDNQDGTLTLIAIDGAEIEDEPMEEEIAVGVEEMPADFMTRARGAGMVPAY